MFRGFILVKARGLSKGKKGLTGKRFNGNKRFKGNFVNGKGSHETSIYY